VTVPPRSTVATRRIVVVPAGPGESVPRAALDEAEVNAAARCLGARLEPGDVVLLDGAMGAGKTTFVRAMAHALGVHRPDRVCSPTFTIAQVHPGRVALVHLDLFRLGGFEQALEGEPEGVRAPAAAGQPAAGALPGGSDLSRPAAAPSAAFEALGLAALLAGEGALDDDGGESWPARRVVAIEWAALGGPELQALGGAGIGRELNVGVGLAAVRAVDSRRSLTLTVRAAAPAAERVGALWAGFAAAGLGALPGADPS
jgi:energy-coupling factor transporter ATP-binding protein EcfA2